MQDVSLRACYLFSRLAKLLRQPLARFLPDILASLQVRIRANCVTDNSMLLEILVLRTHLML